MTIDAYGRLKSLIEKQSGELDQFLAEVQPSLSGSDFEKLRIIVGNVMGQGHYEAFLAISQERPDLTPKWVDRP